MTRIMLIFQMMIIGLGLFGCKSLPEKTLLPENTSTSTRLLVTSIINTNTPSSGAISSNTPKIEYTPTDKIIALPTITLIPAEGLYERLPSGQILVSISGTKLLFRDVTGKLIQAFDIGESIPSASFSNDRTEMIFSSDDGNVNTLNLRTLEMNSFDELNLALGPTWAFDGAAILYTWHGEAGEYSWSSKINLYDLETSNTLQLTDETINAFDAQSSPNGKWIAFISDSYSVQATQYKLLLLDGSCLSQISGSKNCMDSIKVVTGNQYSISSFSWSPNSQQIALSCFSLNDDISSICEYDLETNQLRKIYQSPSNVYNVSWSLDGKWIALTEDQVETSSENVSLIRLDGLSKNGFLSDENESVLFWIEKK